MPEAVVGRGLIEILPDFRKWGKQLAADMRVAKTQMDGSTAGLKAAAATTVSSMAKVGKGVSLVGAGVAVASVKMAGDFQAETAVLQTAAGESAKGLKTVRAGILDISKGTGTGIKNLTDGMYLIEKAGFRGSEGLKVLKAAAQGAREENAKLSDVTNAMTSIMASYHLKATDSVRVMNGMKTAAGEGKITMEEFSGAMSTVLPIASANKISFEQVAGAVATLTQHGTSAREATHELGATIRNLASPNMVASREMARFGLSSVDVSQKLGKRGLTGTLDLLTGTILSKMGPSGKILLSSFEGTKLAAQDARIMISKMPEEFQKTAKAFLSGKIEMDDWKATVKGAPVAIQPMLRNFKTLVDRSNGFSRELKAGGPAAKTYTDSLKKMSGGAIGLNTILQLSGESTDSFKERVKKVGESFHNGSKDVEGWKITQNLLNVQLDRAKQTIKVLMIEIGTKLIPVVSGIIAAMGRHKDIVIGLVIALASLLGVLAGVYIATKVYAAYTAIATVATTVWTVASMAQTDSLMLMRAQLALLWVQERLYSIATGIATAATYAWGIAVAVATSPITLVVLGIAALVAGILYLALKTKFFQTLWSTTWNFIKTVTMGFIHWLKDNWQLVVFVILTGPFGLAVVMIVRHWDSIKHAFSVVVDFIKHHWQVMLASMFGPLGLATLFIIRNWGKIVDGAKKAFNAVIDKAVEFGKGIGGFFSKLPGEIADFFRPLPGKVAHWFSTTGKRIALWVVELPGKLREATNNFNKALFDAGGDLISGLFHGAEDFFTKGIPDFFKMLWHGIVDFFKNVFEIGSPSRVMARLGGYLIQGLFGGMGKIAAGAGAWLDTHIFQPVTGFFKNARGWLSSSGGHTISGLLAGYGRVASNIGSWFTNHVYHPVVNFFKNAPNWLTGSGKNTISGLLRGYLSLTVTINTWMRNHVYTPVLNFFRNAGSWLYQKGKDTISGLLTGFKNMWTTAANWVTGRRKATTGALGAVGTLLYQKGRDVISGLWDGLKAVWKDLTKWVGGIAKWIKDHKGPISLDKKLLTPAGKALMHGLLHGLKIGFKNVGSFVYGTGDTIADVVGRIKHMMASVGGAVGLGKAGPVSRFRDQIALALRMLGQPIGYMGLVERRMNQESGGNPNIVNKWDSNWKAGHPSVGLMQVIAGTFRAYAGKYRNTGPFTYGVSVNPMANIYAALNYALHRYGSLGALGRPGGYDLGGIARGMGFMAKYTNQPERVLSPTQTAAFDRLVTHITGNGGTGGGTTVVVNKLVLENHGVIGSKHELENWFVETMSTLKRKGRI